MAPPRALRSASVALVLVACLLGATKASAQERRCCDLAWSGFTGATGLVLGAGLSGAVGYALHEEEAFDDTGVLLGYILLALAPPTLGAWGGGVLGGEIAAQDPSPELGIGLSMFYPGALLGGTIGVGLAEAFGDPHTLGDYLPWAGIGAAVGAAGTSLLYALLVSAMPEEERWRAQMAAPLFLFAGVVSHLVIGNILTFAADAPVAGFVTSLSIASLAAGIGTALAF